MDPSRSVLIRYTRNGSVKRASGLRVGGQYVLTADHCADGADHRLLVDGVEYPAAVHVRSYTRVVDVAVLIAPTLPELDPLSCALVNREVDQDLDDCRAMGFPWWKKDPHADQQGAAAPVLARVRGTVPTAEGRDPSGRTVELLSFKITDPEAQGRPVKPGPVDQPKSLWGGMSGAGVVTEEDVLVGVIRSHAPAEGGRSLTVTPLEAISTLPPDIAIRFWSALGLDDHTTLPRLPLPVERVGRVEISAAQVVVGTVPQQPLGYVSRDTLDHLAHAAGGGPVAVVQILTGQRGMGKTQVAAAYARRRISDGWNLVGWVNADAPDRMLTDLAAIAEALGVQDPDGDSAASAGRLTRHLTTRKTPGLLVFDNATHPDRLRSFLPAAGSVQVVITTTDQAFTELGIPVPVGTYSRGESVTYLHDRTGLHDPEGADTVADQLGDHPLALAQAAATIRRRHWTYPTYLDRLANTPITRLLARLPGQDYPLAAAPALMLGITSLEGEDSTGHIGLVLRLLAVLSRDGVPRNLLLPLTDSGLGIGPEELDEILESCAAASVITWSVTDDAVLMHRLLARILRERDQLNDQLEQTIGLASALVGQQLINGEMVWQRDVPAGMIDQIDALWAALRIGSLATTDVVTDLLGQRAWAVGHLVMVADVTRAVAQGQAVLANSEQILGFDHPITLASQNNLALAYHAAGRFAEAMTLFETTLRDRERILGPDHPDTLTSRNTLARTYKAAGRLTEARPIFERTLTDRERVLGHDHPHTFTSRNNLARCYQASGEPNAALPLFEQTVNDFARVLGPNHPYTLAGRNNLACCYQDLGQLDVALPLLQTSVADCLRVLGPDHPDTLTSRNNLALAYQAAGRIIRAISLHRQTFIDRQRILGPDHPDTLASRNNLDAAHDALWQARAASKDGGIRDGDSPE